jgi:hypothetical protein
MVCKLFCYQVALGSFVQPPCIIEYVPAAYHHYSILIESLQYYLHFIVINALISYVLGKHDV